MIKIRLLLISLLFVATAFAKKITISGYVQDANTGERISSAYVYEANLNIGTITNNSNAKPPATPVRITKAMP